MNIFARRLFFFCVLIISAFFVRMITNTKQKLIVGNGETMGTTYSFKVFLNEDNNENVHKKVNEILIEVNRQMSTYIPTSEISLFNANKNSQPVRISKEFYEVLKVSKRVFYETNGAFDPTLSPLIKLWGFGETSKRLVPPKKEEIKERLNFIGFEKLKLLDDFQIMKTEPNLELNLSAIAKGYGVDLVARYFDKHSQHYLIEIGGEVFAKGRKEGTPWKVGVEKPSEEERIISKVIELDEQCVASSGDYRNYFKHEGEKYSHVISSQTGMPVINKISGVTVIAKNCTLADAYATAIIAINKEDFEQKFSGVKDFWLFLK